MVNICVVVVSTLLLLSVGDGGVDGFMPLIAQRGCATCNPRNHGISSLKVASSSQPPPITFESDDDDSDYIAEITEEHPLKVIIAGAGVGGLALANVLTKNPKIDVTVIEKTDEFKRFGGPIQLASNALQVIKEMDLDIFHQIMNKFTFTGNKENGIKDGIRTEWYAKFDLATPAETRNMPYTGVIDRPNLQEIYLNALPKGCVKNGDGVVSYTTNDKNGSVSVTLESGKIVTGDVLIGADGIWSAVRAQMHGNEPNVRGEESGATYSGYTLFAGDLAYDSFDNGQVGYKVYIGPGQYFVITDIGNGNYQWYAFLARPPGSKVKNKDDDTTSDGSTTSQYLQHIFKDWSYEIHDILKATQEYEIEQRDLYDRPPSMMKSWYDGHVALLGDGIHAMMPNLGQGGCQAIEDAYVIGQELTCCSKRDEITSKLKHYQSRRLMRSATVQGLSRFASDIIIKGFDTPAKIVWKDDNDNNPLTFPQFENFNYAGIVTKLLQPFLPLFFSVQFNYLYDGYKNESASEIDRNNAAAFATLLMLGSLIMIAAGEVGQI